MNIIISEGDPTGIGYEILEISKSKLDQFAKSNLIVLVSSQSTIRNSSFTEISLENLLDQTPKKGLFQIREIFLNSFPKKKLNIGNPSPYSGKVAYNSLQLAIHVQKKICGNLITLPLSKEWVIKGGIKNFKGHTEELALSYKRSTTMLMYGPTLKVIVLTTHIPLSNVCIDLKKINIKQIILGIKNFKLWKNPRIAICGLNPHAGEGGKIGSEEKTILSKIIKKFQMEGFEITDPISADSLFQPQNSKKYDLILACYHDQGLIPFKALDGKKGINITLGLDFLRVSPDHGTAFDIAGKGLADPTSFQECLNIASKY